MALQCVGRVVLPKESAERAGRSGLNKSPALRNGSTHWKNRCPAKRISRCVKLTKVKRLC